MRLKFIELKEVRDIGELISVYFDFFKLNLKSFLNIFIRYNGIFIFGFLGVSYLMVTGFVGNFRASSSPGLVEENFNDMMYIGFGAIGFVLLLIVTALLNYSLAAVYMIKYQEKKTVEIDKRQVFSIVVENLGKILLFMLLMGLMYLGVFIAGVIISIIPFIGSLVYYGLMLGFTAWMGVSFMAMFYQKLSVTDAFGEGWRQVTRYFWKSVLVNLVVTLLLFALMGVVLMVPGILIGIYAFHSIESGIELAESPFATVVWTLALSIFMIVYCFNQSLSQFVNGVLYFSLHEETYNQNLRTKIDQIGIEE
ncbi:hypothetical protein [Cochleicola gelatinilyticus]|uniref:Glycerophosphoryl diester phosphodiesterase membrane domain-containing protein n=1 Tax=Cochleicola gelatinilyticus TaxID=1763537 RepID=A0A167G9R0_9FLAO|nr:hypothetical protein [Cochleicola gelatinilyticus]OAB77365.1 hypothetical protein ULVI_12760 [Cochleicola gelatinilyticus]